MKIHELKTWTEYFSLMWSGVKKFELRKDDRGFEKGDILYLREYDHVNNIYMGREMLFEVNCIIRNVPDFGLQKGYCIMSVTELYRACSKAQQAQQEPLYEPNGEIQTC